MASVTPRGETELLPKRSDAARKTVAGILRLVRWLFTFGAVFTGLFAFVCYLAHYNTWIFEGWGGCRQISVAETYTLPENECVAIIGASSGIGKELADILAYEAKGNVKLILTGRTENRAERVAPHDRTLLASQLDLEEHDSIQRFAKDLKRVTRKSCPKGKLGLIFLNAGMIYAPGYDESFVSKDGRYDRLFATNFHVYSMLMKLLVPDVVHPSTRVVFVSTISHYVGSVEDVFHPRLDDKKDMVSGLKAYGTSKLALTTMQVVLAKDGRAPNSVLCTPGAADTPISNTPKERMKGGQSTYPFFLKQFDFSSRQGAEFVLQAALLSQDAVKLGEMVMPYFFPFAEAFHMKYNPTGSVNTVSNTMIELFLQKVTFEKGKLWVCPVSKDARSEGFQQRLKEQFLS